MTAREMIDRYRIVIADEEKQVLYIKFSELVDRENALDDIKAKKAEIVEILEAELKAEQEAKAIRDAKIAGIEGLKELRSAMFAIEEYAAKVEMTMNDEFAVDFPKKPNANISELMKKYPRAAAYLTAAEYECSDSYAKSVAGKKAKERIINGEDYVQAIADMKREWAEYCNNEIWN